MRKVEGLVEKAKNVVEEEEEEDEEGEEESEDREEEEEPSEEVEDEEVEEVEEGRMDLSQNKGSLANILGSLVPVMETMSFDELKEAFLSILQSPELKASQMTRSKWIAKTSEMRSKNQLMSTISNIYLRGSGLGTNPDDYK
jgi:hypothetical protein